LLNNFGIQSFVHLCLEFWRVFNLKRLLETVWAPERVLPRDVAPRTPRRPHRTPVARARRAPENPAVRGRRRRHCAPTANDARKWSRLVPRGLCALAGGRTAILHWLSALPHVATALRPSRCSYRPRRSGETASTRHPAYKTPSPSSLARARAPTAVHCCPPLAAPVNLLLRLCPWPTDVPKLLPSTHLSSYTHVMV
jgi:hypothetical protein